MTSKEISHWAWQHQISANTEKHVIANKFGSASTGRLGTLLALMCMSVLFEVLPVPALADLAPFWQQIGTEVEL